MGGTIPRQGNQPSRAEARIKVIQSVMGHKDIQTTMDIHAEVTGDKKKKSLEQVFIREKFY